MMFSNFFSVRFSFLLILEIFVPIFSFSCTNLQDIEITKNGNPNMTIVLSKNANKDLQWSSKELQKYIQQISGVKVPIVEDGANIDGHSINIGKTSTTLPEDYPDTSSNPEAFAVKIRDKNIYLLGRYPTSTMFAVFSFIEDQLGVRWFAPGDVWEYVPDKITTGTLKVSFNSYSSAPYTSPRVWSSHNYGPEWEDWKKKNKVVNSEKTLPFKSFQNYIYKIFPPKTYAKTHPEYYPLINGKRVIPADGDVYWWPCIGNLDVQTQTIKFIRNAFDRNPALQSFSLGMDDVYSMCECDLCSRMDGTSDDTKGQNYSNRYYEFVNIVAKEIKKTHPGRYIGALIYLNTKNVPTAIERMEDNVFGYMAQDWAKWANTDIKKHDKKKTKDWKQVMEHVARYNYIGFNSISPRIFTKNLAEAIKFDKELGVQGMYSEIYTFLPHSVPMIWIFSKLQWNPDLDLNGMSDEFYNKMFGESASEIKEYFDFLELCWNKDNECSTKDVYKNPVQEALIMNVEELDFGFKLLDRARLKTSSTEVKQRIDQVKGGLKFYSYFPIEYDLIKKIQKSTLENDSKMTLSLIQRLGEISKEREINWKELLDRDDLLGKNLRGLQNRRDFYSDIDIIESPIIPFIITSNDVKLTVLPNDVDLSTISNHFPERSNIRNVLYSYGTLMRKQGFHLNTLLQNRHFKDTLPNQASKQTNSTANISTATNNKIETSRLSLKNWTGWSRRGLAEFSEGKGKNSEKGVYINATQAPDETGIYLQNVSNLKPGKTYLAIVWVKVENADSPTSSVYLGLRKRSDNIWYTKDSKVYKSLASTVGDRSGWQRIATTITLPMDANGISFQMTASNAKASFTAPEFYLVP